MHSPIEPTKASAKILEASLCGIYVYSIVEGKNLYLNPEYTAITGWTLDQINDLNAEEFAALFHPEDQEKVFAYMDSVSKLGDDSKLEIEYRFKHRFGHWIWCLSRDSVYERDEQGNVTAFIGSFIEITEIKNKNEELHEKNEQLEQFVYTVSHDLRAPLVTVAGFVSYLFNELKDTLTEKQLHRLERIRVNVDGMSNMLAELLSISRILRRDMDYSTVSLSPIVDSLSASLESSIQKSFAQIQSNDIQHDIYGSARLVAQCLQNLITNAIKFRDPERSLVINLKTEELADAIVLKVEDTGIGISEKDYKRIFGIFESINSDESAGVGLAIVKAVMDKHNGSVAVKSEVGKGSVFSLSFPKPSKYASG